MVFKDIKMNKDWSYTVDKEKMLHKFGSFLFHLSTSIMIH